MRNIFLKFSVALVFVLMSASLAAGDRKWEDVSGGLPYFQYQGQYSPENDPALLIGNSRIKVNAHVWGFYELISGERIWARFNADPVRPNYGRNKATAIVDNREIELAGPYSIAAREGRCKIYSGAGFVRYVYDLGKGLECSRMISVMPSGNPESTMPLILVSVTFTNNGSGTRKIGYEEAVSPCFVPVSAQYLPEEERSLRYVMNTEISFRCITASFGLIPQEFIHFSAPGDRSSEDFSPQSIFLYCDDAFLVVNDGQLKASASEVKLRRNQKHTVNVVIGFAGNSNKKTAAKFLAQAEDNPAGAFASMWQKCIPDFSSEKNEDVRHELYRSAYSVEAAAVYSDYFKETFIPGKFGFSTRFGENVSNSDHLNAALQACCTNPQLAKSIIRYVLKQTSYDGMVPQSNRGYGLIPSDSYGNNLIHLELFNAVAEYLARTGDYAFLEEWLTVYPMERGEMQSVRTILERCFLRMREEVSVSPSANAMQAAYLPRFLEQMVNSGTSSKEFIAALQEYTDKAIERFRSQESHNLADLPYLLETRHLTNAQKRDLLDQAQERRMIDLRAVPGLATFDGIEASTLFRNYILNNLDPADVNVMNAWAIYCHFRLME